MRYEEFRNNDTNVAVPKFGIRWQPLDETLTVRATIGKGFREPSLIQLYGSPTSALGLVTDTLPTSLGGPAVPIGDPRRTESEQNLVFTSSPALTPEDSVSFSGGIVWTPKFVPGLTASVDIWDIEQTGLVALSSVPGILNREQFGGLLPGESGGWGKRQPLFAGMRAMRPRPRSFDRTAPPAQLKHAAAA